MKMKNKRYRVPCGTRYRCLVVLGLLALSSAPAFAETVELVTYYPSVANAGKLHAESVTVGNEYSNVDLDDGEAIIRGSLGIGPGFGAAAAAGPLHVVGEDNAASRVLFMPGVGGTLNVGIGVDDPAAVLPSLLVLGGNTGGAGTRRGITGGNAGLGAPAAEGTLSAGDKLVMWNDNVGLNHKAAIGLNANSELWLQSSGNNANNKITFHTSDASTTPSERMRITAAGNVGIGTETPNSRLDLRGSMSLGVTVATASLALTEDHNVILTNGAGNITITLPAAANRTGRTYYIKKTDAGAATVTIVGVGGALIDGGAALVLFVQGDAVRVVTNGFNWFVISDEIRPHVASMSLVGTQSVVTGGAESIIDFNAENFDIGNIADTGTNRFTVRRAGRYLVTASWWTFALEDSSCMGVRVSRNNGAGSTEGRSWVSSPGGNTQTAIVETLNLAAGDFLEMRVYKGGTTNDARDGRMTVTEIRP